MLEEVLQITAGGINVDAGIGTFDAGISLPDDNAKVFHWEVTMI